MKSRKWDWVLLLGVLCFVAGGILLAFGYLKAPMQYALPVLGLMLIGAGASGKRRAS
jgi:uncharacterized membrane protein HdeD (DUF308 family)